MKVKLEVPVSPAWQRALARAAQDRAAGISPERVGCRTYRIASTRPDRPAHTVHIKSVVRLEVECDCEAGERNIPCRHAASAWDLAVARIAANAAPIAPVAPLAPAPLVAPDRQGDWWRAQRARASA